MFQHVKGHLVIIKIINLEIDADILALICFCKNIQHNGSELISLTGNETQKGQVTVCVCLSLSMLEERGEQQLAEGRRMEGHGLSPIL